MYEWSGAKKDLVLITGHTHQPVFNSLTHLERLYLQLDLAKQENDQEKIKKISAEIPRRKREYDYVNHRYHTMRPSYFNAGCCCFDDGTITGLEIAEGFIRLVKWSKLDGKPTRIVAEEEKLENISARILLHISPVLTAHFIQGMRNLSEGTVLHRFHQLCKQVAIFDATFLQLLKGLGRFLHSVPEAQDFVSAVLFLRLCFGSLLPVQLLGYPFLFRKCIYTNNRKFTGMFQCFVIQTFFLDFISAGTWFPSHRVHHHVR